MHCKWISIQNRNIVEGCIVEVEDLVTYQGNLQSSLCEYSHFGEFCNWAPCRVNDLSRPFVALAGIESRAMSLAWKKDYDMDPPRRPLRLLQLPYVD